MITRREAVALLEAARDGIAIPVERAEAFACAVLELDPVARLALAVLDGGLFTGARLVELAAAIAGDGAQVLDAEAES